MDIEDRLREYCKIRDMTSFLVERLLRKRNQDNTIWTDALACKYIILLWFQSNGCVLDFEADFKDREFFPLEFKNKRLILMIMIHVEGISVLLSYLGDTKTVSRGHTEKTNTIPKLKPEIYLGINSDEKYEFIRCYNEVLYSLWQECYRPIFHPIHADTEPRSTAVTPKEVHQRRK